MTGSARRRRTYDQVLAVLAERGALTRAELGRRTGLSRSAVAGAVAQLEEAGLVSQDALASAVGRGRRPAVVTLRRRGRTGVVVAIDFGHAHVTAAVATSSGELLAHSSAALDVDGQPEHSLDRATELAAQALELAGCSASEVTGIAAGIPGPLDIRTQAVRAPTILREWIGLNPAQELSQRFGRPVAVANDADMGARGEHAFGAARGIDDFFYIKASHGVGAGLVLAGHTYRGATGIAGEIGHTHLEGATNLCRCGNRGCLETVVSITEVRRQLAHVLPTEHLDDQAQEPPSLAHLAERPAAARVITEAGRTLGLVLASLVNCLNPAAIILGGDLSAAGEPLAAGVRESVNRYAQAASASAVTITISPLQDRSELMGAIATAIHHTRHEDSVLPGDRPTRSQHTGQKDDPTDSQKRRRG